MVEIHQGGLSDDRPLALDGNPSSYFLANFDRQNTPEHDEGGAIFLVVDRLAFKLATGLQRVGEPSDHFRIRSRALKNPRRIADDFGRVVTRQFLEGLVRVDDLAFCRCIRDQHRVETVLCQNLEQGQPTMGAIHQFFKRSGHSEFSLFKSAACDQASR
jgi:hypothetical protein